MISRKYLELVILSILNKNEKPLTGYAITKEINKVLGIEVSPGTIYPKLKNLTESGYITKKDNDFSLTSKGKEVMSEKIPGLLRRNTKFIPNFFKLLTNALSAADQTEFMDKIPIELSCGHCFGNCF